MSSNELQSSSTEKEGSPATPSTDSESFETWTLIVDKPKTLTQSELQFQSLLMEQSNENVSNVLGKSEIATTLEEIKSTDEIIIENRFIENDDLSDGISIISETESGECESHPEIIKRPSNLNFPLLTQSHLSSITSESLRLNCEGCSECSSGTATTNPMPSFTILESNTRARKASSVQDEPLFEQSELHCPVKVLFYLGLLLAVVAFLSKLKYDEWETMFTTKAEMLTTRVNELELKNNLMRAEIDFLTRQVNHLMARSGSGLSPSSKKSKKRRDEKLKVWSGHGDTIERIEISKEDLKKPFKCADPDQIEIGGNCIYLPRLVDTIQGTQGKKATKSL